jgi:hypothetical protein
VRKPRASWPSLRPLAELLGAVTAALPLEAGSVAAGASVAVSALDLDLPLEARIEDGAELRVSLPRGRLSTGFDVPLGRLVAHYDLGAAAVHGGPP